MSLPPPGTTRSFGRAPILRAAPDLISSQRGTTGGRAPAAAPARHRKPPGRAGGSPSPPGRTRASVRRHGAAHLVSSSSIRGAPSAPRWQGSTTAARPKFLRASRCPSACSTRLRRAIEPVSAPPGASRSGRHLYPSFTGSAGPPHEGGTQALHQIAPADFSLGPRDAGES
ncbi:hypothetical protein NDU88_001024 [Pleurodeles waltl]|uniref:Uncharacterized protein n=1 Tax=Pleurodeles waltl TaxID=8319 RepID=A0AAV7S984_PLEWA|nr:hypothetical protein NDU88_001024 [Pleurodeles waltl]